MNRGDGPSVVSFHNPIILFSSVSTVAKMTRIQDSYRTKWAAQATPEIRMQTRLNPAEFVFPVFLCRKGNTVLW